MARIVDIQPKAERDLDHHTIYIADDNPEAARRFLSATEATFTRLVEMPRLGSRRQFQNPELADLRMWPVPGFVNYLIFYRPTADGIQVIRVLHGAQDRDQILGPET